MADARSTLRKFREATRWLEKFVHDPTDPFVDEMVVKSSEEAIIEYLDWMYADEGDYEGLTRFLRKLLSKLV